VSANCVGVYCLADVGHLFKSLDFLGSYSNIGWFYIVDDVGHPLLWHYRGLKWVICIFLIGLP
jgi:hypothetical protein